MISWKGIVGAIITMVLVTAGLILMLRWMEGKPLLSAPGKPVCRNSHLAELKATVNVPVSKIEIFRTSLSGYRWDSNMTSSQKLEFVESEIARAKRDKEQKGQKLTDIDFQLFLTRFNCTWTCDIENGKKTAEPAELKASALGLCYYLDGCYGGLTIDDICLKKGSSIKHIPCFYSGCDEYIYGYEGVFYSFFRINDLPDVPSSPFSLSSFTIAKWSNSKSEVMQRAEVKDLSHLKVVKRHLLGTEEFKLTEPGIVEKGE